MEEEREIKLSQAMSINALALLNETKVSREIFGESENPVISNKTKLLCLPQAYRSDRAEDLILKCDFKSLILVKLPCLQGS